MNCKDDVAMRITTTESDIQQACVEWFRLAHHGLARLLFAVPNGGARSAITGARLKREGVVSGVSDLILLVPRGGFHALCIEMKTDMGRQSKEQKEWQRDVEDNGYQYVVCRSVSEFVSVVDGYLCAEK